MPNIIILGRGLLYNKIKKIINRDSYKNINIRILYTEEPWKYLSESKIFVSLQKYSNYPSQSLIEAMLCGCIPIIIDNADSYKMASRNLAFFLNKNFNNIQLVEAIINILKYSEGEINELNNNIRKFAIKAFNINNQVNYFKNLYWDENYVNKK